jgi:hypothetical protein
MGGASLRSAALKLDCRAPALCSADTAAVRAATVCCYPARALLTVVVSKHHFWEAWRVGLAGRAHLYSFTCASWDHCSDVPQVQSTNHVMTAPSIMWQACKTLLDHPNTKGWPMSLHFEV